MKENKTLRSIQFAIADFGPIDGFTDGTTWNGFLNVRISQKTHAKMIAFFADEESDLLNLKVEPDGLIDLNGYCCEDWKQ